MKEEIIELLVDNTGVSTEQAKVITKEIYKLRRKDLIKFAEKHTFEYRYSEAEILVNEYLKKK